MPLDAKDEVGGGTFGGLTTFDGFDNGILRAASRDAEAVSRDTDGLVVAGVDGEAQEVVLFGGFVFGEYGAEQGFGCDGCGVGNSDLTTSRVVDGKDAEVLYECATAPDVEELDTETDGEDGFVEVVGVLEEELIDVLAGVVGGGAL